ncbi:restriction endonuclease subunit S [Cyanobium sp. NS01]|uniref:restriction endonuclease subunit S n=1 Tax=Cyanobium sp. NS01 TaxID=261284 RepID=UPI0016465B6B|nr:restriction endonuclease subunit S [Cyanobium sp. NS01]QNI70306.1 Putative Type I restriction-modification system S subunit [Cyanobium sp. NS01]
MARDWPHLPKLQSEDDAFSVAPEGWSTCQIEHIFEKLEIGKRFDQKTSFPSGKIPVIDQSAYGFVGYHDEEPGVVAAKTSPVITFANHTCEMRVMRRPFSVIQNVFPMVGRPGVCETLFFYYSTKGRVHLEEYKGHYPDFRRLWINLPPLAEQKAIAAVLGALDDKIELNRRMNATLEAMARALYQSWFVDFDPVRAKLDGREPVGLDPATAALFPEHFVESALGPIPQRWEVCSLANKIELLSGGTPKTSEPNYWDGDIPWYSVKDAPSETDIWVIQTEKQVTKLGVDNSATQVLPEGTTIISARGTVGRLALVGTQMAMNQSCYGVRGVNAYADFFTYFSLRQATADLQQRTHGTVFDTITRQTFETLDYIFPPAPLMQAFDRTVEPSLAQMRANIHQSHTLTTLRDTLLPKLLSGELMAKDAESLIGKVA